MAYTLDKYYATINVTVDGQSLWNPPDQTVLWPTYFTLVTSIITSIFAAVVLGAYYWSTQAADRIDNWKSILVWLALLLKGGLEAATSSSMYATGAHGPSNGPQSLWYQTCTATSTDIALFSPTINLPQFCTIQACLPCLGRTNCRNGEAFLLSFPLFWMLCLQ
jgi:hypothetical protein